MSEKVFFSEKQKFNQWWLWLLLIGLNGMFIFKIVKQIYYKNIYATEVAIDAEFTIGFSIAFLVTTLFYLNVSGNMGLQLEILNKTNLLIGTNNPDELKDVLIQLSRYKS